MEEKEKAEDDGQSPPLSTPPPITLPEKDKDLEVSRSRSTTHSLEAAPHLEAQASANRPTSGSSRSVSVVPQSNRRGLLGRLTVLPEISEPKDYSRRVKWFITFVIAMAAAAAPMGSAIFFRTYSVAQWNMTKTDRLPSCSSPVGKRFAHISHNHQFVRCIVHAGIVHLPFVVVILL